MAFRLRGFVPVALLVVAVGCGRGNPVAPTAPFSGTWTGTVVDSTSGSGSARLVLEQRELALSGTLTTTFGGVVGREGPIQGTAGVTAASLTLTPATPVLCGSGVTLSGVLSLTLSLSGGRLTGSYSALTCGGAATGTLSLTNR
jgi:hypothetical protein